MYERLPLPMYLVISLGVSLALFLYFLKNIHKYPKTFLIGMILLIYTSFSAGLIRLILVYEIVSPPIIEILRVLPLPGLLGFPLICVGSYIKVKDEPLKKRIVVITSLCMLLMALLVILVVIMKMLENE